MRDKLVLTEANRIGSIGVVTNPYARHRYSEHVRVQQDGPIYRAVCFTCGETVGVTRSYLRVATRDAMKHHQWHRGRGT